MRVAKNAAGKFVTSGMERTSGPVKIRLPSNTFAVACSNSEEGCHSFDLPFISYSHFRHLL